MCVAMGFACLWAFIYQRLRSLLAACILRRGNYPHLFGSENWLIKVDNMAWGQRSL